MTKRNWVIGILPMTLTLCGAAKPTESEVRVEVTIEWWIATFVCLMVLFAILCWLERHIRPNKKPLDRSIRTIRRKKGNHEETHIRR